MPSRNTWSDLPTTGFGSLSPPVHNRLLFQQSGMLSQSGSPSHLLSRCSPIPLISSVIPGWQLFHYSPQLLSFAPLPTRSPWPRRSPSELLLSRFFGRVFAAIVSRLSLSLA